MSKKNRKRNRKKNQLLKGIQENYPSKCPSCNSKTILRTSQRTRQKFLGCLGFPNCNWSFSFGTVINPVPKYIPKPLPKKEPGDMEAYYHELQLRCDVGDEEARIKMDKLERNFRVVYL